MKERNCKDCPHAAKLNSAEENYYICFPVWKRTVNIGEGGAPEWCPLSSETTDVKQS